MQREKSHILKTIEAETRQGIVEVIFANDLVGKKDKRVFNTQWSKDIWSFLDGLQNILDSVSLKINHENQ